MNRDHAWVGKIYDARAGRFIDEAALGDVLARTEFVLLGETHDNADHHALQARYVRALVKSGRRPALAFEMFDTDQSEALRRSTTPEAVRRASHWDRSGWPAFALYAPLFEAAFEGSLPVVAANLPSRVTKALVFNPGATLPADVQGALDRTPLSGAANAELSKELGDSHCGHVPAEFIAPMALAQRARDAQLAISLSQHRTADGAVLVAGSGHVRNDRAVPAYLRMLSPEASVKSVVFVEVDVDETLPRSPIHDFYVFTPGIERKDLCP